MYNVLKGTHDIIKNEADKFSYVENFLFQLAEIYNFEQFRTPIIEQSDLFLRSIGDSSDIVRKEMYVFKDKGDRLICLRPEITASIIRSIINNKLLTLGEFPVKAFYCGPCFRYERPQQGRFREFHQFGVESLGKANSYRDVEIISFGYYILKHLGFSDITLKINFLGDDLSRESYKNALRDYFKDKIDSMCEDCKERYNLNILRILDCKVESDKKIINGAPSLIDYLSKESKQDFESILKSLDSLEIKYEIDKNLVRGLDYYSGIVFEFDYTSKSSKNYGAIAGGGHYNKIIQELGGPNEVEGCGLALGLERVISILTDDGFFDEMSKRINLYLIPLGQEYLEKISTLTSLLRNGGFIAEACLENKSLKSALKIAARKNADFALILGENEFKNNVILIKDLSSFSQEEVKLEDIFDYLDKKINSENCCCHHDCDCC